MKKIASALLLSLSLLSGCMTERDLDLSDVSPQTFESLPYEGGGLLCRTPVPVPDIRVVSRTVQSMAGSEGRIREVKLPRGVAFGIWTSDVRAREIRNYFRSFSRNREVRVSVRLTRVGRLAPYLLRTFPVRTRQEFTAARWREGDRILALSGFFMKMGPHIVPVFSLEERSLGWFTCRTTTPGEPAGRISFGPRRATVKTGAETLTIDWEAKDAQR